MTRKFDPRSARQGRRGVRVLVVLLIALVLAAGVWLAVELYGESIDAPAGDAVEDRN